MSNSSRMSFFGQRAKDTKETNEELALLQLFYRKCSSKELHVVIILLSACFFLPLFPSLLPPSIDPMPYF